MYWLESQYLQFDNFDDNRWTKANAFVKTTWLGATNQIITMWYELEWGFDWTDVQNQ